MAKYYGREAGRNEVFACFNSFIQLRHVPRAISPVQKPSLVRADPGRIAYSMFDPGEKLEGSRVVADEGQVVACL
jgi:hypothetical protein